MNQFLPSRYSETVHRLALGIEPLDAQQGRRLNYQIQAAADAAQLGLPRPPIERHNSNLFVLRYQRGVTTPIDLRFFDSATPPYKAERDRRRIVPRRLSIPLLTLADVENEEKIDKKAYSRRIRRPAFFPGAAYDFSAMTTGLRGKVVRNGKPMRWARVVARLDGTSVVVGNAHGDDRGEFLLLINAQVTTGGALPKPLMIEVSVLGPAVVPTPNPVDLPALDPLWDLPLEVLSNPGDADPVAGGAVPPPGYTASVTRVIEFTLGRCLGEEPEFQIP
ncbi:MAG TPA: hypothetical protein VKA70_11730 [Blastocatellia bacterium]|nr:hypothetical protein [Blastocatellia bacterium]